MENSEPPPAKTMYEIENDDFNGKGPFTGEEIDAMIQAGEIKGTQKVRKVHTGKVISAHAALLSARANDLPPRPPTKGKFFAGILLVILGLGALAFLFYANDEGERVRGKLFVIPALLVIGGARMLASNSPALKS